MESSDRGSSFALDAFSLCGDVALVTGGGTGIGFAIASAFVSTGARVVISGRSESVLRDAASSRRPSASYVLHNVTPEQRRSETTDDKSRQVYDTHVTGALSMSRAVLPKMIERGSGNILFIASMASLFGIPQVIAGRQRA
ncbi:MAG TPA: SDR family NAD(P)-dependent oxidoreductase [Bryobacteraceae bacterium]|jgi:gluconate 5-dehydrogenase|nr:SDR family NAD(P)-dependent oxidoreductase [Bryobacteraceae bacterium]